MSNTIGGFDLYAVECAVEAETHTKCDVFALGIATLLPEHPGSTGVHPPVIWLHNGAAVVGAGMDGSFNFWNSEGKFIHKLRHGDTQIMDITVRTVVGCPLGSDLNDYYSQPHSRQAQILALIAPISPHSALMRANFQSNYGNGTQSKFVVSLLGVSASINQIYVHRRKMKIWAYFYWA